MERIAANEDEVVGRGSIFLVLSTLTAGNCCGRWVENLLGGFEVSRVL